MSEEKSTAQVQAELLGLPWPPVDENAPVIDENKPDLNNPDAIISNPIDETKPTVELGDDEVMALLNKRGIKVSSLNDLLPKQSEEEIQAATDKRKNDMLAYGLSTGKFKKEEYDSFTQAQTNKMDVIKNDLTEKIKAANPDLTPDQIEEQVALYTFANRPADDLLRVEREQELIQLADSKLQKKFKNIYSLETDFEQYEQGVNNKTNLENKVKAALPVYQKDVATILGGLKSWKVPVNDTQNPANNQEVELTFSDKDLQELEEVLLTPDNIVRQVRNGYTVEKLTEEAELVLLKQHFKRLISQGAKDYNSKQKEKYLHGIKGMIPNKTTIDVSDDELATKNLQVYQELLETANGGAKQS